MIIGYIRVSTIEQELKNQKNAILDFCNAGKMIVDDFIEIQSSSRRTLKDRKINDLVDRVQEKDIVVVTELSRLGRSVSEVLNIVNTIIDKKCRLICIKENIDIEQNQSIQSKIMVTMISLFADLERDLISKRTKEMLAFKKSIGVKLGRPTGPGKSKLEPLKEQIQGYLDKDVSILSTAKLLGVSYTTIHNFIRKNKMLKRSQKEKIQVQKLKIEKIRLNLIISNNQKGTRSVKTAIDRVKQYVFPHFDPDFRNIGHNKYILRIRYKENSELNEIISQLLADINETANFKNCLTNGTSVVSLDRSNLVWNSFT